MRDLYIALLLLVAGFIALGSNFNRPVLDYKRALASSPADKNSLPYAFAKAIEAEKAARQKK